MTTPVKSPSPPPTPEVRIVVGMDGVTREIVYDAEGCVVSRREVETSEDAK